MKIKAKVSFCGTPLSMKVGEEKEFTEKDFEEKKAVIDDLIQAGLVEVVKEPIAISGIIPSADADQGEAAPAPEAIPEPEAAPEPAAETEKKTETAKTKKNKA